jgi:hypothetical protein
MKIALFAALLLTAPAAALGSTPTPAQIRRAVNSAEHSHLLWATINICNTSRHLNQLGVRAEMPALGFASSLSMTIQVEYSTGNGFRPDPGAKTRIRLGSQKTRVHQAGHTFQFVPPAGLLTAEATFEWQRAGKLLGRVTLRTTGGHHNADFGDPPRYSAATCRIG